MLTTPICCTWILNLSVSDTFDHIKQWTTQNEIIKVISNSKTKDLVFRRPFPSRLRMYPSVDGIAKQLDVRPIVQDNFNLLTLMLSSFSQGINLLKRLRDQGLDLPHFDVDFVAIAVNRIIYTILVWGSLMSKEQIDRFNAFFKNILPLWL